MDFGIARPIRHNELTRTGMNLGTAYYMAPGQHADAKEVDWRADQYAFGVLMYELLTGRVPMGAVQPIERFVATFLVRSPAPSCEPCRRGRTLDSTRCVSCESRIVARREDDAAGAIFNAFGRSIALGTIAGALFAYFDSLSIGRIHEWMYPSGIAVGIGTALMVEFCETFFRSRYRSHVIAAFIATVVWIGLVLVVAQKLTRPQQWPGDDVVRLGVGQQHGLRDASLADRRRQIQIRGVIRRRRVRYAARTWRCWCRRITSPTAIYLYSALSGILPGMIIAMASPRRRLLAQDGFAVLADVIARTRLSCQVVTPAVRYSAVASLSATSAAK